MKITMPKSLRRWLNIQQLKRDPDYIIPDCCKLDAAGHVDMLLCFHLSLGRVKSNEDCKGCEFYREEKVNEKS